VAHSYVSFLNIKLKCKVFEYGDEDHTADRAQAKAKGYTHIYGVRLKVTNVNQLGSMVEAIAYGTAVISSDSLK